MTYISDTILWFSNFGGFCLPRPQVDPLGDPKAQRIYCGCHCVHIAWIIMDQISPSMSKSKNATVPKWLVLLIISKLGANLRVVDFRRCAPLHESFACPCSLHQQALRLQARAGTWFCNVIACVARLPHGWNSTWLIIIDYCNSLMVKYHWGWQRLIRLSLIINYHWWSLIFWTYLNIRELTYWHGFLGHLTQHLAPGCSATHLLDLWCVQF